MNLSQVTTQPFQNKVGDGDPADFTRLEIHTWASYVYTLVTQRKTFTAALV